MPRAWRPIFVFIFLAGCYAASLAALSGHRTSHPRSAAEASLAWTIPPVVIQALAGEFKGLVADVITLETSTLLGTEVIRKPGGGFQTMKKQHDWDTIIRLFKLSQALDPYFEHTYMVAQGWLPWTGKRVNETIEILQTAKKHRTWDWQPAHFIGFNTYYFLKQPGEAGKIFLAEARDNQKAPSWLAILGARLAQKGGETASAIALMESMLAGKVETDPDYQDMMDRYQALRGVLVIEEAAKRYQAKFNTIPGSLEDLMLFGVLTTLPPNPYKVDYCMDAAGKIYFDYPDCRSAAGAPPAVSGQ